MKRATIICADCGASVPDSHPLRQRCPGCAKTRHQAQIKQWQQDNPKYFKKRARQNYRPYKYRSKEEKEKRNAYYRQQWREDPERFRKYKMDTKNRLGDGVVARALDGRKSDFPKSLIAAKRAHIVLKQKIKEVVA